MRIGAAPPAPAPIQARVSPATRPRASNQALETIGPGIQRQHSYVAGDKTFWICLAENEDAIRRHSGPSGFPVASITEILQIIDPLTVDN